MAVHFIQMLYQFEPKPYATRLIQSIWMLVLFFAILLIPAMLISDGNLPVELMVPMCIILLLKAGMVFLKVRYAIHSLSVNDMIIMLQYYDKNELCVTSFQLTELQVKLGYTITRVPKPYLLIRQNNKRIGTFYEDIHSGFTKAVIIEMQSKLLQLQSEHNRNPINPS